MINNSFNTIYLLIDTDDIWKQCRPRSEGSYESPLTKKISRQNLIALTLFWHWESKLCDGRILRQTWPLLSFGTSQDIENRDSPLGQILWSLVTYCRPVRVEILLAIIIFLFDKSSPNLLYAIVLFIPFKVTPHSLECVNK